MRGFVLIAAVVLACLAGAVSADASADGAPSGRGASEIVAPAGDLAPSAVAYPPVAPRGQHDKMELDRRNMPETGMGVRPAARGTDTASAMTLLAGIAVMAYGLRKRRRR
jgi:hypothetical protein